MILDIIKKEMKLKKKFESKKYRYTLAIFLLFYLF